MSAPERIWVDPGAWEIVAAKTKVEPDYDVQYIRKDASDAAIAAARAEGVREGMLKAAGIALWRGEDEEAHRIAGSIRAAAEAQP